MRTAPPLEFGPEDLEQTACRAASSQGQGGGVADPELVQRTQSWHLQADCSAVQLQTQAKVPMA